MADDDLEFIPTEPGTPFPLGRTILHHDPRNRLHAAAAEPPTGPLRSRPWSRLTAPFDQGQESSCTTQAATGLLRTQPHTRIFGLGGFKGLDEPDERYRFYRESQQYDPWEGEAYEGTSTDAPFKLLRHKGVIDSYSWLFGPEEVKNHLQRKGAVTIGTVWYWSMFSVDKDGYIVFKPESGEAGGHAYELVFCHPKTLDVEVVNSWGQTWGRKGRAKLRFADLEHLLNMRGEAMTVLAGEVNR
jgi:hypothetical protein